MHNNRSHSNVQRWGLDSDSAFSVKGQLEEEEPEWDSAISLPGLEPRLCCFTSCARSETGYKDFSASVSLPVQR